MIELSTTKELEVWHAYHLALVARGDQLDTVDASADRLLLAWRSRRGHPDIALPPMATAEIRAELNTTGWEYLDGWDRNQAWYRRGSGDQVDTLRQHMGKWYFEAYGEPARELAVGYFPEGFGNRPSTWNVRFWGRQA